MTVFEQIREMAEENAPTEIEKARIRNLPVSAESLETMTDYIDGYYLTENCRLDNDENVWHIYKTGTIGIWDNLVAFMKSKPSVELLNRKIAHRIRPLTEEEEEIYGRGYEYDDCFCWILG